jgi:hypothetical protein
MDRSPLGKGTNLLVGSQAGRRADDAVPVAKTLDDMKRLKEEILPKIEAM